MRINVGVFFGGSSVEHEISVISALQAIHAFDKEKYNTVPIYIGKDSVFYTGDALLEIDNYTNIPRLLSLCNKVIIARDGNNVFGYRNPPKKFGNNVLFKIDVAFPVVHGTNCEDGTLQGFLELLRIPYAGSDVLSSSIGMDKTKTKDVLMKNNIPVLDYISFYSRDWHSQEESITARIEKEFGYPVIVKPANLGSSVGIKKASDRDELREAVELASSFSIKIIIEKAIRNLKEINCAVLGDYENAYPSVCEEPVNSDEILSYNDKYLGKGAPKRGSKGMGSLKRKLPADIPPEMESQIKNLAVKAFKALGCSGVVRIDFLVDMDNENKIYVNELNTIPGSLSFYLWEAAGKPFSQLLDELISLALKRDRERQQLLFTYDSNIFAMKGTKTGKA